MGSEMCIRDRYKNLWDRKVISREELTQSIAEKNNVVDEYQFELRAIK